MIIPLPKVKWGANDFQKRKENDNHEQDTNLYYDYNPTYKRLC